MSIQVECPGCLTSYCLAEEQRGKPFRCTTCLHTFVAGTVVGEAPRVVQPVDAVAAEPPRIVEFVDEEPYVAMPVASLPAPRRRRIEREPIPTPQPRAKRKWSGERWALLVTAMIAVLFVGGAAVAISYRIWRGSAKSETKNPITSTSGTLRPQGIVIQPAAQRIPLVCNSAEVLDVCFSDDATHQAVVVRSGGQADRYDLSTALKLSSFEVDFPPMDFHRMSLSRKGSRFAYQGRQNNTVIVSADNGLEVARFEPYSPLRLPAGNLQGDQALARIELVSEDRLLTISQAGSVDLWTVPGMTSVFHAPGQSVQEFHDPNTGTGLSLDRQTLAVFNGDGFDLRAAATGNLLRKTVRPANWGAVNRAWGIAFSSDGKTMTAVVAAQRRGAPLERLLTKWEVASGQLLEEASLDDRNSPRIGRLAWWGSSYLLASGSNPRDGQLYVWPGGRNVCDVVAGHWVGAGLLAPNSPDGRVWYVTDSDDAATAFLTTVDLPVQQMPAVPGQPGVKLWLTAKGVVR
jgi:hypothetical protein